MSERNDEDIVRLSARKRLVRISRGTIPEASSPYTRNIHTEFMANNLETLHKTLLTRFTRDYTGFVYMPRAMEIEVYCQQDTKEETWIEINDTIRKYKDPETFLVKHHVQNMFVTSPHTNSLTPKVLTSFIMGPPSPPNILLDSIKLVVECSTSNTAGFATYDVETSKDHFIGVELYNFTSKRTLLSEEVDIRDVFAEWKSRNDPYRTPATTWTSVQLFEISNLLPKTDDAIWQIKLCVKRPDIDVAINSVQNIYYEVTESPKTPPTI